MSPPPLRHESIMAAHRYLLDALRAEMAHRSEHDDWEVRERFAVTLAANEWANAHYCQRLVTVDDVEAVEHFAVGHVDYASKLALYVAELIHGVREIQP